jgi:hypothetical protein
LGDSAYGTGDARALVPPGFAAMWALSWMRRRDWWVP